MDELRLQFDPHIQLEFHPAKVTSDAGLLAYRELDDALGLTDMASDFLKETRSGRNIQHQHQQVALLRQSVYSRLAGYEDINDAQRLRIDPAMRTVVSRRAIDKQAASTNTVARFETEMLTFQENLEGLKSLNETWVDVAMSKSSKPKKEPKGRKIILDMDSSESPVYGHQEESAYNGYFESRCYHPLFCYSVSISMEIAKEQHYDLEMSIVQMAGDNCLNRLFLGIIDIRRKEFRSTSEEMRPLPIQKCMSIWKVKASFIRFGFQLMKCSKERLSIF